MSEKDNIQRNLENHYRLEELFETNKPAKTLYEYMKTIGVNVPDRFWIQSLEKGAVLAGSERKGRTLEKDLNYYMGQNNINFHISLNDARLINTLYDLGEGGTPERFIEAFEEGLLSYVDSSGNAHNGLGFVDDVFKLVNDNPGETEYKYLQKVKTLDAITSFIGENGFNYEEYTKFFDTLNNPAVAAEGYGQGTMAARLVDAARFMGDGDYEPTLAELSREIETSEINRIERENAEIIARLDEYIESRNANPIPYPDMEPEKCIEAFKETLDENEAKAFDQLYRNTSVALNLPTSMSQQDRAYAVYKKIYQDQTDKLNRQLQQMDTSLDEVKQFAELCNQNEILDADIMKLVDGGVLSLGGEDIFKNKLTRKMAELTYKLNCFALDKNTMEWQKNAKEWIKERYLNMHAKESTAKAGIMAKIDATRDKLASYEQAAALGGPVKRFFLKEVISQTKKQVERLQERANKYQQKETAYKNKAEYLQTDINGLESKIKYKLNGYDYEKIGFSPTQARILEQFSLTTAHVFTEDEGKTVLRTMIATDGAFNPKSAARFDFNRDTDALNMLTYGIEAKIYGEGQKPLTLTEYLKSSSSVVEQGNGKTLNEMVHTVDSIVKGNKNQIAAKAVTALPPAEQKFILDQHKKGVDINILNQEIISLYNKEGYSIKDAEANIKDRQNELNRKDIIPMEQYAKTMNPTQEKLAENINAALNNIKQTAKMFDATIRCEFIDKEHNKQYNLTVSKNGNNLILRETDLTTGRTEVPIKSTEGIKAAFMRTPVILEQMKESTREFAKTQLDSVNKERQQAKEAKQEAKAQKKEERQEKRQAAREDRAERKAEAKAREKRRSEHNAGASIAD